MRILWIGILLSWHTTHLCAVADESALLPHIKPDSVNDLTSLENAERTRHKRLTAYLSAWRSWLARKCQLSADQLIAVESLCEEAVESSQETWRQAGLEGTASRLPDFAPLELSRTPGSAELTNRTSFQVRIRKLLTVHQLEIYSNALSVRNLRLMNADRSHVIAEVDEQLHLSVEQQMRLENELRALIRNSNTSLFGFETAGSPLDYLSPKVVAWRIGELDLTPEQRLTMESFFPEMQRRQANVPRFVVSLTNWEEDLRLLSQKYLDSLKKEMEERVVEYSRLWQLDPRQVEHLQLAASGAVTRVVSDWRAETMERFLSRADQIRKMADERAELQERVRADQQLRQLQGLDIQARGVNNGLSIGGEAVDLTRVQNHPLWRRAISQVRKEVEFQGLSRTAWGREACIDFVQTALERELWLHEDQIEPLRQQIREIMPSDIDRYQQPGRELAYISIVMKRVSPDKLALILNESQIVAWKELARQFDYSDNSVQISLRDGSKFVLEYLW
ncbi:MAG: hypothetical protein R3C20_23165 [Planctomycetaceae bacterium]